MTVKRNDVLVIGGGIGGLTAGALLAQSGKRVTILEASREWGGCAGKFQRKSFLFPVGATLGMGLEKGGIHERIFRHLGKKVVARRLDRVMDIHFPDRTVAFLADRDAHVRQLQSLFPKEKRSIQAFYTELYKIAASIRSLMGALPVLPPATMKEWLQLAVSLSPSHGKLMPYFPMTMNHLLKKHGLDQCHAFRHFIDGQIIDSMQTTSKDCSLLLGCLALDIYHEGAYYVEGGLYQFAHLLKDAAVENGATATLGRKVVSMKRKHGEWLVTDHRGNEYRAEHVVCNAPIHSLAGLLEQDDFEQLSPVMKKRAAEKTWGTMTLYLTIDEQKLKEPLRLFQQISSSADGSMDEGRHLFMSVSAPDDRKRAPEGYRTVTVSTHISLDGWDNKTDYDLKKDQMTEAMLKTIDMSFPSFREAIIDLMPGAPRAWERYTYRPEGMVGGFPQTRGKSLFFSLSHRTKLPGFWLCGDSVFPGGGTIGVSVSGVHVFRSISGKKLIR